MEVIIIGNKVIRKEVVTMRNLHFLIRQELTVKEQDLLRRHFIRPYLLKIAAECGYNVLHLMKLKFSEKDIENRILGSIRQDKSRIGDIEKALAQSKSQLEAARQLLFDFLEEGKR